ncbi:HAD-IIB family hydrolase [Sphingomonas sp. CBMAI 2297]|uniref:HAD-IIB family hydrolase n=1 Tax=Sphingomonas sp. CBMAI 2297 TaxID=2991720 RepID=UPI0024570513|nr:HAD-IIB family hydrolase [Sphingomonas sp. CBMAI 2297]MDH4744520.1 HAD-IIB family hydrolase [Sphingomonas sp. CBMAI 2297]
MKRLVAFDLDGTLAESKQALTRDMADMLARLLTVADAAVISGGDWPQFRKQVAEQLPAGTRRESLWLMPTTGTKLYRYAGEWREIYAERFSDAERAAIHAAFDRALARVALPAERIWGERIEDRGSQFTFSGLGQQAPLAAKAAWDPDRRKRAALQAELQRLLPDLSIRLGGTTSIDVTRRGIDKAHGLERLAKESGIPIADMLFVGDALYPGGNDEPARRTGVDAIQVRDPAETRTVIATVIACLHAPAAPLASATRHSAGGNRGPQGI